MPTSVPSLDHHNHSVESEFNSPSLISSNNDARASALTYCSTVPSIDDDEDDDEDYPQFIGQSALPQAEPATPQEFADLFPCSRRLIIKHDDSTLDGNMNVRVDTDTTLNGRDRRITLFHLRMYELRNRDFSIRRYGRDCGREVCHVKRRHAKAAPRPTLQRSVSKVLDSFRGKHDGDEPMRTLERSDSGYGSTDDASAEPLAATKATNSCVLEFSNYAHVDITRRGVTTTKRYDFEYWGKSYSWKRSLKMCGANQEAAFQLVNNSTGSIVAYIRPDHLSPAAAAVEDAKGGFVPPCSMYINSCPADPVSHDNADVAEYATPLARESRTKNAG